jgi:hypothetical protein
MMTGRLPSLFAGSCCSGCPAARVCPVAGTVEACGERETEDRSSAHPSQSSLSSEDFLLVPPQWKRLPPLPDVIAIADTVVPERAVGLRLHRSLQPKPWLHSNSFKSIAVLHGRDCDLERLWSRRVQMAENFRSWGVPLVVGPAFSTWWPETPFASLRAIARTAEAARIIARHVPVVPSVVWRFDDDLLRWAAWLKQSGAEAVAVDLGTLKARAAWSWGLRGLAQLGELLAPNVPTLLANGPSTLSRMTDVIEAWPGVVVPMSQRPWQLARHGRALNDDFSHSKDVSLTATELMQINADMFERTVQSLIRQARRAAA